MLCKGHAGKRWTKYTNRCSTILILGSCVIVGLLVCLLFQLYTGTKSIKISEVCSNNQGLLGKNVDYIELYNESIFPCKLDALYLSDDNTDLKRCSLNGYEIAAKGYNVVWLEQINDFALGKDGDCIYLSDDSGRIIDTIKCPKLECNLVYAKIGEEWEIRRPSPGYENDVASIVLPCPLFSIESGFYNQEFELEIISDSETSIYYTLDGSEPDTNSYLYEKPIHVYDRSNEENVYRNTQNVVEKWKDYEPGESPVEKAFIVKAKAINANGNCSDTITGTYFVNRDNTRDVISVIAEPDDLFGTNGIYVTGEAYDDWYLNSDGVGDAPLCNFTQNYEIPATFFYFEKGNKCLEQSIGLRIQGRSSRRGAMKRFSFFARKKYDGSSYFQYPLVGERQGHSYFVRGSFANTFVQSLVKDRNVAVADSRPVSVFINGEYWYDTYLTERLDKSFFADKYGIYEDDVWILKDEMFDEEVDLYLNNPYFQLKHFAEDNDLGLEENYTIISKMMDIQSYIDFVCINVYCVNEDVGERHNHIMWRAEKREFGGFSDGKWRWVLHDIDVLDWIEPSLYGGTHAYEINTFSQDTITAGAPFNQTALFKGLKENEDFCEKFVLTFMDLVNDNFSIENVTKELEKYGEDITWKDSFFLKRSEYIIPALAEEFDLKCELADIYISVNDMAGGAIKVNTIEPDMKNGNWRGSYFGDYPVEVTAIAKPGYEFVSWEGDALSAQSSIKVDLSEGDMCIEAIFRKCE